MISLINPSAKSTTSFAIGSIPQYDADPTSPAQETSWVLKQGGGGGAGGGLLNAIIGLSFAYLSTGAATATTYQFSYRTKEGTTVRETLS